MGAVRNTPNPHQTNVSTGEGIHASDERASDRTRRHRGQGLESPFEGIFYRKSCYLNPKIVWGLQSPDPT
jgi:hypothetical protein